MGFRNYGVSYAYKRGRWSLFLMAESQADAEARLQALAANGVVDGAHVATLPGWFPMWAINLLCAVRNWVWRAP